MSTSTPCSAGPPSPKSGRHPLPDPDAFAAAIGRARDRRSRHGRRLRRRRRRDRRAARVDAPALGHDAALLDGGPRGVDGPTRERHRAAATAGAVHRQTVAEPNGSPAPKTPRTPPTSSSTRAIARGFAASSSRSTHAPATSPARSRFRVATTSATTVGCSETTTLRERLHSLGVERDTPVISYCGSGVTACHNLLVLERLGYADGRLYPGSWSQWSSDPDRAVATGD